MHFSCKEDFFLLHLRANDNSYHDNQLYLNILMTKPFLSTKRVYWIIWCAVVLVAAFPKFILDGDITFLKCTGNLSLNLLEIAIPLVMIMVAFTFDFAYTLTCIRPDAESLRRGFIKVLCIIAVSLLSIVLTLYYTHFVTRTILFCLSFVSIISLKYVTLSVGQPDVVELRKP